MRKKGDDAKNGHVSKVSQRALAEMIQLRSVDVDKTAVRRIENGERYVTDIELKILCDIFNVSPVFFLGE